MLKLSYQAKIWLCPKQTNDNLILKQTVFFIFDLTIAPPVSDDHTSPPSPIGIGSAATHSVAYCALSRALPNACLHLAYASGFGSARVVTFHDISLTARYALFVCLQIMAYMFAEQIVGKINNGYEPTEQEFAELFDKLATDFLLVRKSTVSSDITGFIPIGLFSFFKSIIDNQYVNHRESTHLVSTAPLAIVRFYIDITGESEGSRCRFEYTDSSGTFSVEQTKHTFAIRNGRTKPKAKAVKPTVD